MSKYSSIAQVESSSPSSWCSFHSATARRGPSSSSVGSTTQEESGPPAFLILCGYPPVRRTSKMCVSRHTVKPAWPRSAYSSVVSSMSLRQVTRSYSSCSPIARAPGDTVLWCYLVRGQVILQD